MGSGVQLINTPAKTSSEKRRKRLPPTMGPHTATWTPEDKTKLLHLRNGPHQKGPLTSARDETCRLSTRNSCVGASRAEHEIKNRNKKKNKNKKQPCLERERGERREERREKEAEMGKVVEEKKKKKKGRPSLLDLQKRSIKQEQEQEQLQQQKQNSNSNPNPNLKSSTVSSTPVRRSTRRNPNPDPEEDENDTVAAAEDEEELSGRRREKKLKLVLRLPSQLNSASLNSASCGSDSNAEEENVPASHKKRKINAIGDGSGHVDSEKVIDFWGFGGGGMNLRVWFSRILWECVELGASGSFLSFMVYFMGFFC